MNMLSQDFLVRLRKLRISATSKRRGQHKGMRRSHKFGSSLEFSDFREYQPGDDVRQIDWNVYGRTQKHYIKRYLDEQEIKVALYLDCTSSMRAVPEKWERAKQLSAAFAYMTLSSEDRLAFVPVSAQESRPLTRKGAVYAKPLLFEILKLEASGITSSFSKGAISQPVKGAAVHIIISDGLEPISSFETMLRRLAQTKGQVYMIQLLSQEEADPDYEGDIKLLDSESRSEVNVSMRAQLIMDYKKKLKLHNRQLEQACKRLGMGYLQTSSALTADEILLRECYSRGWVY